MNVRIQNVRLLLLNILVVYNRINKIGKKASLSADKEVKAESLLLEKLKSALENDIAIRDIELDEEELKKVKSYNLLTVKPIVYVANVTEEDLVLGTNEHVEKLKEYVKEDVMIKDYTFENPSKAISTLLGRMENGNDSFYTLEGVKLGEYLQKYKTNNTLYTDVKFLVCNLTWMEKYNGKEPVSNPNWSYVKEHGYGHELYNFYNDEEVVLEEQNVEHNSDTENYEIYNITIENKTEKGILLKRVYYGTETTV